jgi:uncharacterized protein (DUF885 family)
MRRPLVSLLLAAACATTPAAAPRSPRSIADGAAATTALADEILAAFIAEHPASATLQGLPGATDDGLEDNGPAALTAWRAREDAWAKRLEGIDGDALWGRPEWITYGFVKSFLDGARGLRVCKNELWPVSQMDGWQVSLSDLAELQRVGTAELRAKALARWRLMPRLIDQEIASAREGLRQGYSTPRANVGLVIEQLDGLLEVAVDKSPFYSPAARDPELAAAWTALLRDEIYPAIRRERDFLRDEYRGRARESLAIAANPDGAACYRAAFLATTTLDRDPRETFELGQATVAKNLTEAQELARRVLGVGELPAIVAKLRDDRANHFASRDEELDFARAAVARAHAAMPGVFAVVPRAPVVVEPRPAFLEASDSDAYSAAAVDGSHPGIYHINLGRYALVTRANGEITAFHETYPGHHLQIALASEAPGRHPIVNLVGNSGYAEGWGRYAEALAEEFGLYSSDYPRVQRRLWPARGMVVDPGLHLFGWTAEQAKAYMAASGRFGEKESEQLVYRIAMWPSQLTAYDTGALEIVALRRKAEAALGARFDLKKFHHAVLENGSVTLPMLRKIVEHWIETQR